MFVGLLAELVIRSSYEVQNRPPYYIKSTINLYSARDLSQKKD